MAFLGMCVLFYVYATAPYYACFSLVVDGFGVIVIAAFYSLGASRLARRTPRRAHSWLITV
jgi:hypothetical protein